MPKAKILVIEDDPAISQLIRTTLDTQDYQYHTASTGEEALSELSTYSPDVIILDLGLPDMDGVEIVKRIRPYNDTPIIVASARMEDGDKVAALDAGADDYLTKPFGIDEFLSRIHAALSIREIRSESPELYQNGGLRIEYTTERVFINDKELQLTAIEYKLLCILSHNTERVLTHNFLSKTVWGNLSTTDTTSLRMNMARVRKKLELNPSSPKYLQTHIGVGYRMLKH